MAARNATAAVIGAGDFIGAAIAKKFAAEGFTVFAGRRNGDKLAPLVAGHRGRPAARSSRRSLDARKEEDITAFLQEADTHAPLEVCIFNIGANVNFPDPRHDRARVPQGLGDGLLLGLPRRPRGRAPDAAARPGLHLLHRRHRQPARRPRLRRLRRAKVGLRAVAQAPARELGPKNIHVAHLVIDSGVDTAWVRERIKEREGAEALANLDPAG